MPRAKKLNLGERTFYAGKGRPGIKRTHLKTLASKKVDNTEDDPLTFDVETPVELPKEEVPEVDIEKLIQEKLERHLQSKAEEKAIRLKQKEEEKAEKLKQKEEQKAERLKQKEKQREEELKAQYAHIEKLILHRDKVNIANKITEIRKNQIHNVSGQFLY